MRLFFALPVPAGIRARLAQAAGELKGFIASGSPGARVSWVDPVNYHFALKFLGSVDPARVPEIRVAAESAVAGLAPFELEVRGLGAFPPAGPPAVLWVGAVAPGGAAPRLAEALDRALEPLGFGREKRVYVPHLTIARVKQGALDRRALAEGGRGFGRYEAAWISLMESRTLPQGSVYAEVARLPLTADRPS